MRRTNGIIALLVVLGGPAFAGAARAAEPVLRAIDPASSSLKFSVQHVFVERVTGTAPVFSGTVALEPGSAIPVAASATIETTKIVTGERDRDASLQSADFFDTRKFPTWTFSSTKIVTTGPNAFGMDGLLTIHGVTRPEHFDVTVRGDAVHPMYHAVGNIDRHDFGMTVTRIDPAIGGIASIALDVVLK